MSFFDRIFGRSQEPRADRSPGPAMAKPGAPQPSSTPGDADQRAIERYQYLLRTAPPDKIEQAHQEAFSQLTPQQRQQVLQALSQASPADRPQSDSAADLARSATRVEMQRPGSLTQIFGGRGMGVGGGMGMGGIGMGIGGMLLASVAGSFIGTAIAQEMFDDNDGGDVSSDTGDNSGDQQDDATQDAGSDMSASDQSTFADDGSAGYDSTGFDSGGFDSGFGGGDFGGGDF
ncbi:hypothetical protein G9U51_05670 [Calidifontibacter sp. DB0510]|uniref:Uncharacterized protein n=1 Tax=Metallococcus carri TaxID=1656884 RepID=A0A967AYC2_9MICO|nr:hypothetical protein [Metallococcus carri]NHN55274.1 hypothetical protein [Metallococcus carri]NOP36351.1 hypothetical protein [Calidifontibacter sp. DB2511S]